MGASPTITVGLNVYEVEIRGVGSINLKKYMRMAFPAISGSALNKALDRRDFKLNGRRAGLPDTVTGGDLLRIYIAKSLLFGAMPEIIYEDENLIIVDKPTGLSVDDDGISQDTLIRRLREGRGDMQLCHRLDHNTSGIIVAAKNRVAYGEVAAAFKEKRVTKKYHALVRGLLSPSAATLKAYCVKNSQTATLSIMKKVIPGAMPIITRYSALKTIESSVIMGSMPVTLAEIFPITGRTHQIRAHMAFAGHPVIGDDKYGDRELNRLFGRRAQALRAVSIEFDFGKGLLEYLSGRLFEASEMEL